MKKVMATIIVTAFLATILGVTPASAGGNITLDDTTTTLHFADKVTTPYAWAYPDTDIWNLQIATSYDALVEIKWFDWYPTNDVYELWVDGVLKGTNPAGGTGTVEVILTTGAIHEVKIVWKFYQTDKPIIGGGSYYDITFTVLKQYSPLWFKASGGGVSYSDVSPTAGHFCTIGVIAMSLEPTLRIGKPYDYVSCKGSGTFIDHNKKIKISFDITEGGITRSDKMIWFYGTAKIFDVEGHTKYYDVPVRVALVDDQYGGTNRFDVETWGSFPMHWHGTLLPEGEVTVWVWE